MKEQLFIPTQAKYRIEIESPGFDMARDNFKVTLKRGTVTKEFRKSDLIEKEEIVAGEKKHQFYLCFDTEELGPGDIIVIVEAHIPDKDFTGGIRKEVDRFRLINAQSL